MKKLLLLLFVCCACMVASGCSSVSIPKAPKTEQLILEIDPDLLIEVQPLIELRFQE